MGVINYKCEHCGHHTASTLDQIHFPRTVPLPNAKFQVNVTQCSNQYCQLFTVAIATGPFSDAIPIYPAKGEPMVPDEVPDHIAQDFIEAFMISTLSPKASAALSRRILQEILATKGGYTGRKLIQHIDAALNDDAVPTYIKEGLNQIREYGNCAAHTWKDQDTEEIINVTQEEAQWQLEAISELFDHYYVKPASAENRRKQLEAKKERAGKVQSND